MSQTWARRSSPVLVAIAFAMSVAIVAWPASNAGASKKVSAADTIVIEYYTYYPMVLHVTPGTTIKVHNKDLVAHSLTANGGQFNTGNIAPHTSRTFKAPKKPGTYHFHCDIHQHMKGSIVVT